MLLPWPVEGPWGGVYESLVVSCDERLEHFADLFWDSGVGSIGAGESLLSWDERLRIVFRDLLGPVKGKQSDGIAEEALKVFDLVVDGQYVACCGMGFYRDRADEDWNNGEFFFSDLKGNIFPIDNSNGQVSQIIRSMGSGLSKEGKWRPRRGDFDFVLRPKTLIDAKPLDRAIGRSLARSAVEVAPGWFPYLSESLRGDKKLAMDVVARQPMMIEFASQALKQDREIVSCAVARTGAALKFAGERLQDDSEVVLLAARSKDPEGFFAFASQRLRRDKSFVHRVVSAAGGALVHASDELRGDREIVLAAVSQYGFALDAASDELKRDKKVVLAAIESEGGGGAIAGADKKFLKSRPMVLRAIKSSTPRFSAVIELMDPKFRSDKGVALATVAVEAKKIEVFDEKIRGDREVALAALQGGAISRWDIPADSYQFLSEPLKHDKELALLAVKNSIFMFEELPECLQNSRRIVLAAFLSEANKQHRGAFADNFPHVGSKLMRNKDFVLQLFRHEPSILGFIPTELKVDKAFMGEVWGVRNLGDADGVLSAAPRDQKLARLIARMEGSFALSKMKAGETADGLGCTSSLNVACLGRVDGKVKDGSRYEARLFRMKLDWRQAVVATYETRRVGRNGRAMKLARLWYVQDDKNETRTTAWNYYEPFYYAAGRNRHAFLDEVYACALAYRD